MASSFEVNVSADALLSRVTALGVSKYDAAQLVGKWLIGQEGRSRSFAYSAPLAADDPDCRPAFARSFHHVDWVDGESVVQAGQTVGEDGFNHRLHRIEADFDSVAADVRRLFDCLAEVRSAVVVMLEEARLELNRIDADLSRDTRGPVSLDPGFGSFAEQPRFTGSGVLGGQKVQIWQTKQGVLALPWVAGAGGVDPLVNPTMSRAPQLGELIATRPDIGQLIDAGTTVGQLVQQFGNVRSSDGTPLADLVTTLPADQALAGTDGLLDVVTQHDVLVAVANGAGHAVLGSTLGTSEVPADAAAVSVAELPSLSSAEKFALVQAGISTAGELSAAGSAQVQQALTAAGIGAAAGRGAGLVSSVKVATGLAGLMRTGGGIG